MVTARLMQSALNVQRCRTSRASRTRRQGVPAPLLFTRHYARSLLQNYDSTRVGFLWKIPVARADGTPAIEITYLPALARDIPREKYYLNLPRTLRKLEPRARAIRDFVDRSAARISRGEHYRVSINLFWYLSTFVHESHSFVHFFATFRCSSVAWRSSTDVTLLE